MMIQYVSAKSSFENEKKKDFDLAQYLQYAAIMAGAGDFCHIGRAVCLSHTVSL
jgi:hypothetical protein